MIQTHTWWPNKTRASKSLEYSLKHKGCVFSVQLLLELNIHALHCIFKYLFVTPSVCKAKNDACICTQIICVGFCILFWMFFQSKEYRSRLYKNREHTRLIAISWVKKKRNGELLLWDCNDTWVQSTVNCFSLKRPIYISNSFM